MNRPLKSRVWFYKPGSWRPGWKIIQRGGDEFMWHTIVIGSAFTGAVVFATRSCDYTGDCAELIDIMSETGEDLYPVWPVDTYGHNHIDPTCKCKSICAYKDNEDFDDE